MDHGPPNPRYARQRRLDFWDDTAQANLASAHAMIIGVGALGCPCADLLARAGVGRITLVDRDLVDITNLHRQTLFTDADAQGRVPKAQAGADRLAAVNPEIQISPVIADFGAYDAERIVMHGRHGPADILIDGTDNFETRYLINDLSVMHAIPYVYAGAIASKGMAAVFMPPAGPCLRCLFPSPPPTGSQPTCETAGVFAPVTAIVAAYQASEALKLLMGRPERVMTSLLEFDLWEGNRRRIDLAAHKDPACPCCGQRRFEFLDRDDVETASICGRDAIQINPHSRQPIDMPALSASLSTHGPFETSPFTIKGRLESEDVGVTVFRDGRAIFEGVSEPGVARALYARYIGC